MTPKDLSNQYREVQAPARRFLEVLQEQLLELIGINNIRLAVPLQGRIKSLASISEKLDRKSIQLERLSDLDDLVGIRTILLFKRDLESVARLIEGNLRVLQRIDTSDRLAPSEFGYHSLHYIVQTPETWGHLPTLRGCGHLRAEIQVRTTAQHIWAEASHNLQYKVEESVPAPIRRAINRVSALLETVDLEFERVLAARDQYRAKIKEKPKQQMCSQLNVDLLESILDAYFPESNRAPEEPLGDLLVDLRAFDIHTVVQLTELLERHGPMALQTEARLVTEGRLWNTPDRIEKNVFLTYAGLLRVALQEEFGDRWKDYILDKRMRRGSGPAKETRRRLRRGS